MIRRLLVTVTVTATVAVMMSPHAVAVMAVAAAEPVTERAPVAQRVHHHTPGMVMGVSGAPVAIDMLDNSFGPAAVTVVPGTTVTWTNRGARFHTITASSPPGAFDSGYVAPAASWSFTFASAGTFVYHCEIHTGMAGTITVVSATATPAPVGPAVDIQDNVFSPASLSVAPGTTVTWTNRGAVPHAVRAEGLLGSGRLAPGELFSFTFTTAGVYAYVCDIHAGMAGTVTVGAATTPVPTPTPTPTPPPAGGANVDVTDDTFTPATLTIAPGTTVTWTNRGSRRHTVTRTGQFDSGLLSAGQTFSFTFTTAGTYAYVCDLHAPAMAGTIVVTGTPPAATPTPTPTPTPAATPPPAGAVAVTVGDNVFSPSAITVTPGTTVVWTNRGVRPHTVTGVGPGSGLLASGQSYSVRFDTVGGFLYVCDLHGGMTGTVVVGAAGAPAPPPPPPPSTPAPPPVPSGATRITVVDDEFQPATITVTAGTTVTWASQGRAPHTITAKDGSFDATIARGSTFTHVFHRPGTYPYRCDFHPSMTGTVVVSGAASTSPSPSLSPTPTPTLAPTPAPPPPPGAITVSMGDSVFEPRVASVRTGTTVVWRNNGTLRHTVTSSDGLFDSDLLRSGETFSITFTRPGTFAYVCAIHPGMGGVVEVTGAATGGALTTSTTASPTPSPIPSSTVSATPTPPPAAAPPVSIAAGDNFFDPKDLEVAIGTTVTWTNRGVLKHTVTFADGATSEILATGQTYSRTFTAAGTHPYLCALHPEMKGTISVAVPLSPTLALGGTATATPSPRGSTTPDGVPASDFGAGALRGDWPIGMLLGAVLALMGFIGIAGPLALVFLQDARRPPMKT